MKVKHSYHFYAIITILSWSLAFALTKITMGHFSGSGLAFWRHWFAFLAMACLIGIYKIPLPKKEDWLWFVLAGICGFSLYTVIFNIGTSMVTAATSSLVIATSPIMTALVASIFLKEKLKVHQWLAIGVEFVGIAVLTMWNGVMSVNVGIFWLLLAAFLFCLYNLCQRRIVKKYPPLHAAVFGIMTGAVLLLPFGGTAVREISTADFNVIVAVAVLALVCSVLAYIFWAKALEAAEKTTYVTNYMFVTPLLATVFGFVTIGEVPDFATVLGGVIIIGGLLLFNKDGLAEVMGKSKL